MITETSNPPFSPELHGPIRADALVLENRIESAVNRRLRLDVPGWPGFGPGQFAMLSPGAQSGVLRSDPLLPRPMAIYRSFESEQSPEFGGVEILYRVSGRGTGLLSEACVGDRVGFVGPLGRGFPPQGEGERAILVAGGTGIASIYELAARFAGGAKDGDSPVTVLFGARSATELMGFDDFLALEGIEVRTATEDGSLGQRGLVTELLESALREPGKVRVYACGPTPMMRRAALVCRSRATPCLVSLENNMACGFGVCLGCASPLTEGGFGLVCRDGPVFDAERVDWDGLP